MSNPRTIFSIAATAMAALLMSACSMHGDTGALPVTAQSAPDSVAQFDGMLAPDVSVLKMLTKQVVIGSTSEPKFGQLNPYGLTVAPATTGAFTKGDLAVCNFNAKSNVQGTGFTIVALHPAPGSKPTLVSSSKTLLGCAALALGPADDIWAAAFSANDNPVLSASGKLEANIKGKLFNGPWGEAFAAPKSGNPAFYESNAGDGTIVRINLGAKFTYDVVARGFAVNHGKPGSIFGPSGLSYNSKNDTLYIVDGTNNTVVALSSVSTIPSGGVIVKPGGKTFGGKSASKARLVFAGSPLNGPISAALLFNGNLVVGNTSNPNGKNLIIELSAKGKVLDIDNVDKGAAGALFGIVATGTNAANTKVYFNDDNDNNLQVLER
jgi:hypothetical protein